MAFICIKFFRGLCLLLSFQANKTAPVRYMKHDVPPTQTGVTNQKYSTVWKVLPRIYTALNLKPPPRITRVNYKSQW